MSRVMNTILTYNVPGFGVGDRNRLEARIGKGKIFAVWSCATIRATPIIWWSSSRGWP